MFKVYKIFNTINDKLYVGYTSQTLRARFLKHISWCEKGGTKLQRAIHKHGKDHFTIELIEECETKEQALIREIFYINEFNSYKMGYNSTLGGEPPPSIGRSAWNNESAAKFTESREKWFRSEDGQKFKIRQAEMFKQLNPVRFVTPEMWKKKGENFSKWLMTTEEGKTKRLWSAENMRKVQKQKTLRRI